MNYLAHLVLSGKDSEVMTGNFMGDFLTRRQIELLPINFVHGYNLHIFIDKFTDVDRGVDKVIDLFRHHHRKYASVVSDVIFDYFLVINWDKFYDFQLKDFEELAYNNLQQNLGYLPNATVAYLDRLISGKFIDSYKSLKGLEYVFERMDKRTTNKTNFPLAIKTIEKEHHLINNLFIEFYTKLKIESENFLVNLQNGKKV